MKITKVPDKCLSFAYQSVLNELEILRISVCLELGLGINAPFQNFTMKEIIDEMERRKADV